MLKGILFDIDGTMVDNMMVHHRAWQQKLASLGLELSIEEVKEKIHGVNIEILERLFGDRFTEAERIGISNEKEAAYREIYFKDLKPLPGLINFLKQVQEAGIPMAVGTAAPPENANFVLDNLGIRSFFKAVFHSENVKKGKPDPEIFQLGAAAIGVPLKNCLIFEDSVTGAAAANNAGSLAIIVTTTHTKEEFQDFPHILQFIRDYQHLDLTQVQASFEDKYKLVE